MKKSKNLILMFFIITASILSQVPNTLFIIREII